MRMHSNHSGKLQNHIVAWVGRDLKDHESLTPLPQAGPPTSTFNTRPGCPGPHPTWPWTPPGTGYPQPLWASPSGNTSLVITSKDQGSMALGTMVHMPQSSYPTTYKNKVATVQSSSQIVWTVLTLDASIFLPGLSKLPASLPELFLLLTIRSTSNLNTSI